MSRKFNWLSSTNPANANLLANLNSRMLSFYSQLSSRKNYQDMVDTKDNVVTNPSIITRKFIDFLKNLQPTSVLEVGCGAGRIYQFIKKELPNLHYIGIEVSDYIIEDNINKYPEATWYIADAYNISAESSAVDVCFSFYVLEHLIFPEKAIIEMLRIIKPGGHLILIFPDFVCSKRLASQRLGFSEIPTAKEKLQKGKIIDALVSLYDSRIRLPKAMENAVEKIGAFPVNAAPKCLSESFEMVPDVDAIYIASKKELKNWAVKKGYQVSLPEGDEGIFKEHAFVSIQKPF